MSVDIGPGFLLQTTMRRSVVWTIGPAQPERVTKGDIRYHIPAFQCGLHALQSMYSVVGLVGPWYLHVYRIRTDEGFAVRLGLDNLLDITLDTMFLKTYFLGVQCMLCRVRYDMDSRLTMVLHTDADGQYSLSYGSISSLCST